MEASKLGDERNHHEMPLLRIRPAERCRLLRIMRKERERRFVGHYGKHRGRQGHHATHATHATHDHAERSAQQRRKRCARSDRRGRRVRRAGRHVRRTSSFRQLNRQFLQFVPNEQRRIARWAIPRDQKRQRHRRRRRCRCGGHHRSGRRWFQHGEQRARRYRASSASKPMASWQTTTSPPSLTT